MARKGSKKSKEVEVVQKFSGSLKIQHTKKRLHEAMVRALGIVTKACEMVGVDRTTYYRYYNEDPVFRTAIDDCHEIALDFAESKLHKRIEQGSDTAIIFFLKTKGKHRGYVERSEHLVKAEHEVHIIK